MAQCSYNVNHAHDAQGLDCSNLRPPQIVLYQFLSFADEHLASGI